VTIGKNRKGYKRKPFLNNEIKKWQKIMGYNRKGYNRKPFLKKEIKKMAKKNGV
jgi:hypothetical protein